MIFETHAHYDDEAFDNDRETLLLSMPEQGIEYVINASYNLKSISNTIALTKQYPFMYGAVGVHPSDVGELNNDNFDIIREAACQDKIISIGEIGLDYHYDDGPDRDTQIEWYVKQVELSKELDKPIIIHSRDAAADTVDIMNSEVFDGVSGVVHCYSYSVETAKIILNRDLYFGIGGVVTFKNARKLIETVEYVPMDRLLLETDCPYLAPVPHRGERNSSLYIPLIAEKIAEIKGISYDEVVEITNRNAKRLFFKEG